jgi:hypothetical protein
MRLSHRFNRVICPWFLVISVRFRTEIRIRHAECRPPRQVRARARTSEAGRQELESDFSFAGNLASAALTCVRQHSGVGTFRANSVQKRTECSVDAPSAVGSNPGRDGACDA